MTIFEFNDYKRFLAAQIGLLPKKGRGQARKLATHLGVHSVVISQILKGERHFTHEQALDVCTYFGLDPRQTEYFVILVLKARAGTKRLENHLAGKLAALREDALKLTNRVPEHHILSTPDMAIFYSNWYYGGIQLVTGLSGYDNLESIAQYFGMSRAKTAEIMDYLVQRGLCKLDKRGRITSWTTSTFIDAESPFIQNHHRNWRLKSLERLAVRKENDFFYSAPSTISAKNKDVIRQELVKFVVDFAKRVEDDTPTEMLSCLNIDWFDF